MFVCVAALEGPTHPVFVCVCGHQAPAQAESPKSQFASFTPKSAMKPSSGADSAASGKSAQKTVTLDLPQPGYTQAFAPAPAPVPSPKKEEGPHPAARLLSSMILDLDIDTDED